MPGEFFYHQICQWCSGMGDNELLKKCGHCRLVSYCNPEHQKCDWIIHKDLCKTIAKVYKLFGFSLFNFHGITQKEWNQHRTKIMFTVEFLLSRKLEIFERQMILFPNACNLCFNYNVAYYPCVYCRCVYYCCEEHMIRDSSTHEKNCQDLKLCLDLDLFSQNDPANCKKNVDFLTLIKRSFPNDMKEFLENDLNFAKIIFSEELSFIFSLLFGLWKSGKQELLVLSMISVHIIGSDKHENSIVTLMEIFFHWFPHLEVVNITMIGPDCDGSSDECEGKTNVIVKKEKRLYHEFVRKLEFVSPQIVVAFNCGFCEFISTTLDTWSETIKCVMDLNKVLFITTSYTQTEAKNDFSRIINCSKDSSSEIIIEAERNPFRSLRPLRDWEVQSNVFYLNNYISVFYVRHS